MSRARAFKTTMLHPPESHVVVVRRVRGFVDLLDDGHL